MDLTEKATPLYFATMAAEAWWLHKRRAERGATAADYTRNDTFASLAMGTASLVAPMVAYKALSPVVPGKGKYGTALLATAAITAAATTIADVVARRSGGTADETKRRRRRRARAVAKVAAPIAVATGGIALTTSLLSKVNMNAMWERRVVGDLGDGIVPTVAAILGWDFIYYWNHRWMHTSRYMWAIHVVHHSSEHYNLSTALRQPVADALGTFVPYGLLCWLGVRPELVVTARGINLIYQYWIHTDAIKSLGPLEQVLNTASHHRVHHGVNPQYIDRNHGSIFIVWDRLFGSFAREDESVVYGLTKNINTYNPLRIASNEHLDMLRDVSASDNWSDRLNFVVRGPGWAYAQHRRLGKVPVNA